MTKTDWLCLACYALGLFQGSVWCWMWFRPDSGAEKGKPE
jgi:hypothetical protein